MRPPYEQLVDVITEIVLADTIEQAADHGITIDPDTVRPAIRAHAAQLVAREVAAPMRAIIRELTLSGIDLDADPAALRERIESSPIFHPANALRLARLALQGERPIAKRAAPRWKSNGRYVY